GLCRRLNRGASFAIPRRIFRIASRLGDGIVWYVLIFALPVLYGAAGVRPAIVMALTGALGVALYSLLKHLFVRERPFITHTAIDPAAAPLDRYSFPSGHTLHAVSFAWQASAEAAIEYLSHNHPDVIFMDHLMPGMDGLQAVRAIKNDPRTATIPVMMYTSQEGELFLGQARALGAVGVLPKQIRPTDVSKVLNQLHLVSERRIVEQPSFTPVDAPAEAAAEDSPAPVPSRPLTDSALREHFAELRRALVAAVDTQTDR